MRSWMSWADGAGPGGTSRQRGLDPVGASILRGADRVQLCLDESVRLWPCRMALAQFDLQIRAAASAPNFGVRQTEIEPM